MSQSFHMKVNVENLMCMSPSAFWRNWKNVFEDDNGRVLTCKEARAGLREELAKGHKVIPLGTCDNFDYSGRGCLGHEHPDEVPVESKPRSDGKEKVPSYISREKCGCVVGACVDDGDRHQDVVKKFLRESINDDLVIERVTVGWVREHGFEKCTTHRVNKDQLELPLEKEVVE